VKKISVRLVSNDGVIACESRQSSTRRPVGETSTAVQTLAAAYGIVRVREGFAEIIVPIPAIPVGIILLLLASARQIGDG
jgi:hypothetical protein